MGRDPSATLTPLSRPPDNGGCGIRAKSAGSQALPAVSATRAHPRKRRQGHRLTGTGPRLLAALLFAASAPPLCTQPWLDEKTERLLVAGVEAAAELDLYNARCRGDLSGRHTDNLNKELVSKFRMTVLEVEDDLFPERSYRRVKERLRRDFLEKLNEAGGCKEAKKAEMPDRLRRRYDELKEDIYRLP